MKYVQKFLIGSVEFSLIVTKIDSENVYSLSYVDSDGKKTCYFIL